MQAADLAHKIVGNFEEKEHNFYGDFPATEPRFH